MNRHTRAIVLTCISCRCVIGRLAGCADERSNGFLQLRGDPVRIQIRTYLLATLPRAIADDRYLVGCAVPVVSPANRKLPSSYRSSRPLSVFVDRLGGHEVSLVPEGLGRINQRPVAKAILVEACVLWPEEAAEKGLLSRDLVPMGFSRG